MNEPFRLQARPAELVSAKSFRALLGVSESGFRWSLDSGRLPRPTRLGGRLFWARNDVAFHVAQRRRRYGK
jgi:hypothetical protein